eukprot:3844882-Rhodomonas_salina.1
MLLPIKGLTESLWGSGSPTFLYPFLLLSYRILLPPSYAIPATLLHYPPTPARGTVLVYPATP